MFFFHEVGAFIKIKGLTEVFFPRPKTYYTASTIVVTGSDEGKEAVLSAVSWGHGKSHFSMVPILA